MNKDFIKGMSIGCALAVVAGSTLVFAEPVKQNIEAVYNDIKIIVHGKTATPSNGEPFIYDGTTYLPVRAVAEALGEVVDWDGSTNTVYIGTERPVATPTPTPTGRIEAGYNAVKNGGITSYEEYANRANITAYATDPTRPRLKAGDTFVTADGTSYVLEIGPSGVLGEGLPIATDLGREPAIGTGSVTDHFKAPDHQLGWITADVSTAGHVYAVLASTGEGHWDVEWKQIKQATRPTHHGTDGETTEHGYWKWSDEVYNEYRYGYGQDERSAIYEAWVFQVNY